MTRLVNVKIRSVLQFWICKYVDSIDTVDKTLLTFVYAYMIIINPFIGSKIGGKLTSLVGGYKDKRCIIVIFFLQLFALICFTPGPYFETWWKFLISASLFQIFGSAVLSPIGSIATAAVNPKLKHRCAPIINVVNVGLGSLPGPPIYGLLIERFKEYDKHFAMKFFMKYGYTSLIWITIAGIFKYRYESQKTDKEKLLDNKEEKHEEPEIKLEHGTDDLIIDLKVDKSKKEGQELEDKN